MQYSKYADKSASTPFQQHFCHLPHPSSKSIDHNGRPFILDFVIFVDFVILVDFGNFDFGNFDFDNFIFFDLFAFFDIFVFDIVFIDVGCVVGIEEGDELGSLLGEDDGAAEN